MHPAALAKIAVIAVHLPNPVIPHPPAFSLPLHSVAFASSLSLTFCSAFPALSLRWILAPPATKAAAAAPLACLRPSSRDPRGGGPRHAAHSSCCSADSVGTLRTQIQISSPPRLGWLVLFALIPTHHGYICLGASLSSSVRSTPQRLPSPARGAAAHQARRRSFPRFVLPTRCCCCWLYPRHYHGSITYCRPVVTCPYHRMMPLLSCFLASRIFLMSSRHTFIADTVERTARSRSIHSCSLFALCFFFLPPLLYLLDSSYLSPSARWAITADSPMIACFSWIAELMRR
jgi:hypothetical protein